MKKMTLIYSWCGLSILTATAFGLCWIEDTEVCELDDAVADVIDFPNGGDNTQIKADGAWAPIGYVGQTASAGVTGTTYKLMRCNGPAYFTNPETSGTEHISWWMQGTFENSEHHSGYYMIINRATCP